MQALAYEHEPGGRLSSHHDVLARTTGDYHGVGYNGLNSAANAVATVGAALGLARGLSSPALTSTLTGEAESVASLMGGSIRNINKGSGPRTLNCANCAIATLAGNPASALPGQATWPIELMNFYNRKFIPTTSPKGIITIMTEAGPGARGIVWGYKRSGYGHYFNVVNQKGVIRFLDGTSTSS